MGKTYHTRHDARKGLEDFELSRHPNGTKAKGLRKVLRTRMKNAAVAFPRDRFGGAGGKSSRLRVGGAKEKRPGLRGGRRNVHKAARQESQMEIAAELDDK